MLTGAGEPGTIRALTPVVAYEVTRAALAPLLRERPSMADELASLLARRSVSGGGQHLETVSDSADTSAVARFRERIRRLFDL